MTRRKAIIRVAVVLAGVLACVGQACAQTFETYRCTDGTTFIVGFYPYDSRAYLQIDGRAITLKKRLSLLGPRYSGGGVTLVITKQGTTIRHVRRPVTACELTQKRDRSI
jgi:membrane-bound inhibitor of C-type lysozyme